MKRFSATQVVVYPGLTVEVHDTQRGSSYYSHPIIKPDQIRAASVAVVGATGGLVGAGASRLGAGRDRLAVGGVGSGGVKGCN